MRNCFLAALWAVTAAPASAAPKPTAAAPKTTTTAPPAVAVAPESPAVPAPLPEVAEAIPAPVKALGKPAFTRFSGGLEMAVSASSKAAQDHCNQGLNHLHGGWEFEASRHFAAAMSEDPDCLLAHWGMVMCLLDPSPETGLARNAASDRLLDLVDRGLGTALERGYAYGLLKYMEDGPAGGAAAFRKVAAQFPNDLQAAVFAALFSRGGYDAAGDATPDQLAAEKSLLALMAKHPQSPIPLNALLFIRAEGPDLSESLELARQLCTLVADYPPALHLLGHYQWRCGQHLAATATFGGAAAAFQRWMTEQNAGLADCPEWGKAECYRIVAQLSQGDFAAAYHAARRIAATPLPVDRPSSPGTRFLLWDAQTLPARLLIQHGLPGNANEGAYSLPKPDKLRQLREHSLAYWWMDGLRFALEALRLIDAGDLAGARDVMAALTHHGEAMAKTQAAAAASGERSSWTRAFRALEVLASDVRGRLAMAGPKALRGAAFNWFSSAADRQRPSPMLYPPMLLTPMATHLGEYFLANQQPAEAIEAYQRALTTFPNDLPALEGLRNAYTAAQDPAQAAATAKKIHDLTVKADQKK